MTVSDEKAKSAQWGFLSSIETRLELHMHTVVSHKIKSFSLKWELPLLPPSFHQKVEPIEGSWFGPSAMIFITFQKSKRKRFVNLWPYLAGEEPDEGEPIIGERSKTMTWGYFFWTSQNILVNCITIALALYSPSNICCRLSAAFVFFCHVSCKKRMT